MSVYDEITKVSVRNIDKLTRLKSLLSDSLGITYLSYFSISSSGHASLLTSNLDFINYYLDKKLYLTDPLLVDPKKLKEGALLWSSFGKEFQEKIYDPMTSKFNMDNGLTLFRKSEHPGYVYEAFGFATSVGHSNVLNLYMNEAPTLWSFCNFFKSSAPSVFRELYGTVIDIAALKGKAFYDEKPVPYRLSFEERLKIVKDLKLIDPDLARVKLSKRESECVQLCLDHKTAPEIAQTLGLSTRTVEGYFDNIRIKVNSESRSDFLQKLEQLRTHGLLVRS